MKPLAIDLYAGLGGWTDGLLAEGYDCIGFDIERHVYGEHRYPAQLVVQDVRTLHGSQFRSADLIVASPPCQFFSYCSMPWTRAKELAAKVRADPARMAKELELFEACFRIQREACAAAGRHIPLIVENVRGAIPWVGRSRWNFGSFHLWGDVPALMPPIAKRGAFMKCPNESWNPTRPSYTKDHTWKGEPGYIKNSVEGCKGVPHRTTGHWTNPAEHEGVKQPGIDLSEIGFNVVNAREFGRLVEGIKIKRTADDKRQHIGTSRKFASAMIAKIPESLSRHIGRVWFP